MKKFLLKVTLFFSPLFVYLVLVPALEVAIRGSRISLEIPKDKTILFIGDSHIETSVNEKFIPGAFNWAKSSESYLNLLPRIKKMLEENSQIRTVFITATPTGLGEHADERIFNGDAEILLRLNVFFYGTEELLDSRKTIVNTLKDSKTPKRALKAIRSKDLGTIGEFGSFLDTGESSEELWKEIENDGKLGKKRLSRGDKNCGNAMTIKYLRKIVEFVRSRGGRIIFLNPPIYHADEFFDVPYFESILEEKFPDVEFWDYGDFPMPENCFKDIQHLNSIGAEIFSKELALRMQSEGIIAPGEAPNSYPPPKKKGNPPPFGDGLRIDWQRPTLAQQQAALPLAAEGLTSVFGMGTCVSPRP